MKLIHINNNSHNPDDLRLIKELRAEIKELNERINFYTDIIIDLTRASIDDIGFDDSDDDIEEEEEVRLFSDDEIFGNSFGSISTSYDFKPSARNDGKKRLKGIDFTLDPGKGFKLTFRSGK